MPKGNSNYLRDELYSLLQSDTKIFEFLRQGSLDGLWYWNLEQPEDEWMDSRFWEVLGFDPASREHKASEWQDLIHPDDLELAIKNFQRHCEDPSHPYDQIVRYSHANGSMVWVRCRGFAIRDDKGTPIRLLGVHTELTELMEAEVRLQNASREAQQEFVTLWEDSPVIHLHLSLNTGEIEKCNWNLVKRLGYVSKEEIEGHPIANIIESTSVHKLESLLTKFRESEKAVQTEINLVTQSGESVPVVLNIARIQDGNWAIQHGSITCLEISELRELQHSERLSSFALEHATVSFYLVDPVANILQVNQSTCDNTGFSKEYLESITVHDINPEFPKEAWPAHWEELKQKGFLRFESIILRKDGSTYPVEIETNYVEFEGRAYNFAFVRDITDRQKWIRQKELNEAKLEAIVRDRTRDLEDQRQHALELAAQAEMAKNRAEEAEDKLKQLATKLALPRSLPPKDASVFHISRLTLKDVMNCGGLLRGMSQEHHSLNTYLEALPKFFVDHFMDEEGQSAFDLVEIHLCLPFGELDEFSQKTASTVSSDLSEDSRCLILASSYLQSNGGSPQAFEQSLPCCHPEFGAHSPHLENLLKQFCRDEEARATVDLQHPYEGISKIHLTDKTSANWPKLDQGQSINDVQNILVFGQELSPNRHFIISVFSKVIIEPENVDRFVYLAHSIRLGILRFLQDKDSTQSQIKAVDAMLAGHEVFATDQDERLRETMRALTKANNQLQHSNEELDRFALATSHDLKSPLFAIQNLIYMIEEDVGNKLPRQGWELFGKLKQRIGQMEDLLQSMLEYSRIGLFEDSPGEQDLTMLLKSILMNLLDPPPETKIIIQNDLPRINAPRGALLRVFFNLIGNAIQHGGKEDLTIEISHTENSKAHIFTITDDGVGIDQKHHDKVFGLFRTLNSESNFDSSGMGLSMVKKTLEYFGGSISIASKPGEGTKFTFVWPK